MTMTEPIPVRDLRDPADLAAALWEAGKEIDELRDQLGELRDELAAEVRTRRLVVVDADGGERISTMVPGGRDTYAQLRVEVDTGEPHGVASVVLQASAESSSAESMVYVEAAEQTAVTMMAQLDEYDADAFTMGGVEGTLEIASERLPRPKNGERLLSGERLQDMTLRPNSITVRDHLHTVARARFDYMPPA